MKVQIDLYAGPAPYRQKPTKAIITKNIEALERVIQGKPLLIIDANYLIDTKSILEGIKKQLPDI